MTRALNATEVLHAGRRVRSTLGHFHPLSMRVHLNADLSKVNLSNFFDASDPIDRLTASAAAISCVPAPIVAHELTHFLQATTTATGARQFIISLEYHRDLSVLVVEAARVAKGSIRAPILANADLYYKDREFGDTFQRLAHTIRHMTIDLGGIEGPRVSHEERNKRLLYREDWPVLGIASEGPMIFWESSTSWSSIGSLHLQEGFAAALDNLYRGIFEQPGISVPLKPGIYRASTEEQQAREALGNPYYVVQDLYSGIVRRAGEDCARRATVNEMCLIIDTAMMLEPVVISTSPGERPQIRECSPIFTYVLLLDTFAEHWRSLPKIDEDSSIEVFAEFQNQLLRRHGVPYTVAELTRMTRSFVADYLDRVSPSPCDPLLVRIWRDQYEKNLREREENFGGTFAFPYIFRPPNEIHETLLRLAPVVSVGHVKIAHKGRDERGTYVEFFDHFDHHHELLEAFVYGNIPCRLHQETPRACLIPEHRLCRELPKTKTAQSRCLRELGLNSLFSELRISDVDW